MLKLSTVSLKVLSQAQKTFLPFEYIDKDVVIFLVFVYLGLVRLGLGIVKNHTHPHLFSIDFCIGRWDTSPIGTLWEALSF